MRIFICFATALLVATTASAGARIETINRDIKTQVADGPAHIVLVQDGKVRFANQSGAMILKGSTMYIVDDQRKTYRELDKATMQSYSKQANAAMAQMQEQMKNMPPEQRAQMEKMLGGSMPGATSGKKDVFTSKDTGKTDSTEGRKCRIWHILKNGNLHEELCVVPFASLPGKEDFQKTFKELAEAFEGLAPTVPDADSIKLRNAIDGYPVRVRPYQNGKPSGTETVLKSWTEQSIPASTFEIPASYKKQAMPNMGAGAR